MQSLPNRTLNLVIALVLVAWLQATAFAFTNPGQENQPEHVAKTPTDDRQSPPPATQVTPAPDQAAPIIAAGDELEITVYGAPDLSKHTRVSSQGNVSLPLIGSVRVAGLTSSEAEGALEGELRRGNILNSPQVSVYVKEYTAGGISVIGEIAHPGVYSALGPHRLLDILQAAGGLTEKAATEASIAHRGSDKTVTVELPKNPGELARNNVELSPGDTVVVPKAGIVYVLGEVSKPGGYLLNSNGGTTVLRVLAAAGGPTHDASLGRARMIRRTANGLEEVPVPLKNLMRAKVPDVTLAPDDILYLPSSRLRSVMNAGALVTTLGTVALYRVPF